MTPDSTVVFVAPDDPLAGLPEAMAPPVPDVVRDARRSKAKLALFGKPVARQFGRYIVLGELGRGGMGTVLTAYDPQLDRKVALKLLRDPNAERHAARLEREAKALAKLSHPNVVQVYEAGLEGEQGFVAMELVQGQTLRQWQAERRPWKACVEVYLQAGRGLAAAHAKGLVHRDFKPGNCILDEEGRVRVLDFGLVHGTEESVLDAVTWEAVTRSLDTERPPSEQTRTGTVLGTPAYMPPEQLEGRRADACGDQFSFCVSLYEALYGERPFEGHSVDALLSASTRGEVRPPPEWARVPPRLRRVLVRGLAAKPDDRWPSMEALLERLQGLVAPRARRWVLLSLAVGVLGVSGGLALGQVVDDLERCTDPQRHLTNIWDDGRRQEVEAAILGTALSYAPGTWERVERRLDDYADAWASKHVEVCEASTEDAQGERDRRLRLDCMHERSRALRAAVDVLAREDAEVVEHAVELAAGLPGFGRCDDLDALRAVVPPPEDPAVRREVEALREPLADIEAEQIAGNYIPALEQVEPVVERAEALGYGPLVAEAKTLRGKLQNENGRYGEAEQDLLEAYDVAMEHRHDEVAMDTARTLTHVLGIRQERHAEGRMWGRVALAHAKRSRDEIQLAASLNNLSNVLKARGEYEQARLGLERALRLLEQRLGADHPLVAQSSSNLANTLYAQGEYEQAQIHHERVVRILEGAFGADHPKVASSLHNLGNALARQGEYAQARLHYERALHTLERVLGAGHPDVAGNLINLGHVCDAQGEQQEAQAYYERALRILEKALGADHPRLALGLNGLGNVLSARGEHEQAQLHFERALRIEEKAFGVDHRNLTASLNNLGNVLKDRGQYEQAQRHHERALRIHEEVLGADHPDLTFSLINLGLVLEARGEHGQAQLHLERASRIQEKMLGADHPHLAYTFVGLASIALAREDFATARTYAERAVSIREKGRVAPTLLATARFALARALWSDRAQRAHARTLAEQAHDALIAAGDAKNDDLTEVEQWLSKHSLH